MSLNAAALEVLIGKGLSSEDILEVARALEKKRDNTAAERQARYREKRAHSPKRNARNSNGVSPKESNIQNPEISEPEGSSSPTFALPADIPTEPWAAFERMRTKIRKPLSDDARHLAVARLRKLRDEDGWPPGDVLSHSTLNSYQGLFPPKDRTDGLSRQSHPRQTNPTLDILRAANAELARSEAGQDCGGAWAALPSPDGS